MMSRSFKKNPVAITKEGRAKENKRLSNKRVRRSKLTMPKGNKYRRLLNSWEIVEYKEIMTKEMYEVYLAGKLKHNKECEANEWIMSLDNYSRMFKRK